MRLTLLLLSLLVAAAPHAQYAPAADFASVLQATYSSRHGAYQYGRLGSGGLEGNIDVDLWLPNGAAGLEPGTLAVLYPDGSPHAYAAMTTLNTTDLSSVFVLSGDDVTWTTTFEDGLEYRFVLTMGDDLYVDFPFTASVSGSDDPYTTSDDKTWALETGPWFTHSMFQQREGQVGYLQYLMWVRDGSQDHEVSIRRDGQEIAWSFDDGDHPMRTFDRIYTAASRHSDGTFGKPTTDRERWSLEDVTPGTYQVVVTNADGDVVQEQTIEGGDGTFIPHTRSALDYQPRSRFLMPIQAGSSGQLNLFWLAPDE
ncbi:hypothetical protein [Rubrivirga sp.]|uniref:hypothetical protein n=1 Tax=Rubrivirga sp. TaxID=1885344 RepID=UPI003C77DE2D